MHLNFSDLKKFLNEKVEKYNQPNFIYNDPISIPHQFKRKEDIEISAFLTATIAWGKRNIIIKNANNLLQLMNYSPYEFILNATNNDLNKFINFKHRTFNEIDCKYFLQSLKNIYTKHGGLEKIFTKYFQESQNLKSTIIKFRKTFLELKHQKRTEKHIANPEKNSTAKRLNMFLRWMVRKDNNGVDFGIWKKIPPSALYIPIDIHSGKVARHLNLLYREQNDWKAVEELTKTLQKMDSKDPIKYDFALFGLGINEEIC